MKNKSTKGIYSTKCKSIIVQMREIDQKIYDLCQEIGEENWLTDDLMKMQAIVSHARHEFQRRKSEV